MAQFDSHEYSSFAREYRFTMIKSSPYYSRANRKAESEVKIAKNILKKSRHEDPYLALLAYRNTPQQGYSYSPAQRLMSRRLNDIIPTALSQLVPQAASPSLVQQNTSDRRRKAKAQYDTVLCKSNENEFRRISTKSFENLRKWAIFRTKRIFFEFSLLFRNCYCFAVCEKSR